MNETKEQKKEWIRGWIRDALVRIGVYMQQTQGFPLDMFMEEIKKMPTVGYQMHFIAAFAGRHKSVLKGMPHYPYAD